MRMDLTNWELLQKIPKDQLGKILNSPFSEIDPTFLCFSEVYKAVEDHTPKNMVIIDLGCYAGLQSMFFQDHPAYIGVDSCPMSGVGSTWENLETEDFFMPRLETEKNHYFVSTIQHFLENFEEYGFQKENCMAIMSYVPDKEAYKMAEKFFPNFACYYPGNHYDKNIFRLHGSEVSITPLMDKSTIDVTFNKKLGDWEMKKVPEKEEEEEYEHE